MFSFISFLFFWLFLFDIPILSCVRVILKDFGREKEKCAILFDKHKDLKTNNERIMNNISAQMNEKVTFLMLSGHIAPYK